MSGTGREIRTPGEPCRPGLVGSFCFPVSVPGSLALPAPFRGDRLAPRHPRIPPSMFRPAKKAARSTESGPRVPIEGRSYPAVRNDRLFCSRDSGSGRTNMDAQRSRRTRDEARRAWYAYYRQLRFARWFGFIEIDSAGNHTWRAGSTSIGSDPGSTLLKSLPENVLDKPRLRFAASVSPGH